MKKLMSLLMAALLLCSCTLALAESEWDASFQAGTLQLEKIDTNAIFLNVKKITGLMEVIGPEVQAQAGELLKMSEDGKNFSLSLLPEQKETLLEAFGDCRLLSVGPDGALLIILNGTPAVVRGDTMTILTPASSRGVADEYGKMPRFMKLFQQATVMPARSGVIWSPDGRYISFTHYERVLFYGSLDIDPLLMDTHTGEIFLVATSPRQVMKGGGAIVQCTFNKTGTKYYYTVYGGAFEERCVLYCYDLIMQKNTLLNKCPGFSYYPEMAMTNAGALISINDSTEIKKCGGLNYFSPKAEKGFRQLFMPQEAAWEWRQIPFSRPLEDFFGQQVYYSASLDQALILGRSYWGGENNMLVRADLSRAQKELNEYWIIEGPESRQAALYAWDIKIPEGTANHDVQQILEERMMTILCLQMSPDGKYAFLYCVAQDEGAFFLLRMSDMALSPIKVPEEMEDRGLLMMSRLRFNPIVSWNPDGTLLVGTESGPALYWLK